MIAALTQQFVDAFLRGLELEVEAVREGVQDSLIRLGPGRKAEDGYVFPCSRGLERLVAGQSGTLVRPDGFRLPVTLEKIGEDDLTLRSETAFDPTLPDLGLEVVPWFLYERMQQELRDLLKPDHPYSVEMALRTFGKLPVEPLEEAGDLAPDGTLNEAQVRAVRRGLEGQLSFLWGPPGTGKTTTLARLLGDLLGRGRRVLVVSNTNTALDGVLEHLKLRPETAERIEQGALLRLGATEPDEPCALANVVRHVHQALFDERERHRRDRDEAQERLQRVSPALARLRAQAQPEQLDLFGDAGSGLDDRELRHLLPPDRVAGAGAEAQAAALESYQAELEDRVRKARESLAEGRERLEQGRQAVVGRAQLVLCTLATLTVHPMLRGETFDTVVLEEAGMALLPAVFLAAARARRQVVVVGDPRQLPSIMSSRQPLARKILGRSIFEVTVPDPATSALVTMLDTQYRMAPEIGDLVGGLFYGGGLRHAPATAGLAAKTAREPFPGRGVTVVDLAGKSRCERPPNSRSRFNEESARVAVAIVRRAMADGVESLALITPYRAQVLTLERMLREAGLDSDRVTCSTVHRFQGHEREVVVVDTVDAPPLEPGVLLCDRGPDSASAQLLNVSISRAQAKLIVLAELQYLVSRPTGILGDLLRQAVAGGQAVRVTLQERFTPKAHKLDTRTRKDWEG